VFAGTIWLQEGARPLAEDADDVLRGAGVLAARIISRLAAAPSTHAVRVQELLGLRDAEFDDAQLAGVARELGIVTDGRVAVIGFDGAADSPTRLADVLALSASAFRRDAQVVASGSRVYVVLPHTGKASAVSSWIRGTIAALRTELGVELRAVIATPATGLARAAAARAEVDRVLDSAVRHPGAIGQVTSLAESRTTVLLDEIVTMIAADERLVDPRVRELGAKDPTLVDTLRAYLDSFGDVAAAASWLHVHPNTVRYRVRRIEELLGTSLADPDVRLLLSLSLRAG
jgi:DNA-binding PucR family transcriptional regulator